MDKREATYAKINRIWLIIYYLITVAWIIYKIVVKDYQYAVQSAITLVMPLIPILIFKWLHLKPVSDLFFIYNVFVFFAVLVGMGMRGYAWIPMYDKVLHFLSGILFALIGVGLFYLLKPDKGLGNKKDLPLLIAFEFCFTLGTAVVWEFYEFALDTFLGFNAQWVPETGVTDTMVDMLTAAIGGLIMAFFAYRHLGKGKPNFILKIFDHFYEANFAQNGEKGSSSQIKDGK